jgi:hypothetical protein
MRALKSLFVLCFVAVMLVACGGGGTGAGNGNAGAAADYFSINGSRFTENGSMVTVEGYVDQTSPEAMQFGGQVGYVWMFDAPSGKQMYLQLAGTADGLIGQYNFVEGSTGTQAIYADTSAASDVTMMAIGSGTGGSITIGKFGNIGQPITGSFNVNLCDMASACSSGLQNYTGNFSAIRAPNYGSISKPARRSSSLFPWREGISPVTGRNHYIIAGFGTAGTLTLTLTPSVDVNMAVFSDVGFSTPATCDVASTLNITGSGVETCAIAVTANQRIYMTVSQAIAASAAETYDLLVAKN